MTQQIINTGTAANDGTGDTERAAWIKAQANFTELYGAAAAMPSAYLGPVATRTFVPNAIIGTVGRQMGIRTIHYARDNIVSLQLLFSNFYVTTLGVETAAGAVATITASIEYPIGNTPVQVKFSATAQGSIPDGGLLLSDATAIAIPTGARFAIRTYRTTTVGLPYLNVGVNVPGDGFEGGVSGVVDKTMSGTFAQASGGSAYYPSAILGVTRKGTVAIIGDSKAVGQNDLTDSNPDIGLLARSVGPAYGYANVAVSGDTGQRFVASHTQRVAIAAYASDIVVQYGINDFAAGRTAAQIGADIASIVSYFPGKQIWACTITPKTTGTFADLAGQTVTANEALRTGFNDNLRGGLITGVSGIISGVIDFTIAVESSRNSGKWNPLFTIDGTHENTLGSMAIQSAGVVPVGSFVR